MSDARDHEFAERLEDAGVIAIFRGVPSGEIVGLAETLLRAGVALMEVAFSDPGAAEQIRLLTDALGQDAFLGAGTVTSRALAEDAVAAGARFLVTPHVVEEVNAFGRERGLPVLGGALTPTEIAAARAQGNAYVKIFPAGPLGPGYVRALLGPYPDARLVAVGGVDADNAGAFIRAGAAGVAVGGALTGRGARERGDAGETARALLAAVRAAREERA
ncbi:MAG TPA: bifunctional 4-hydroxy-2-oxoglutarate aldolase/2-dehydro-3-deoxy-phosphogluconate aldolase [Trueperaceae bacterium]|nr:bifunctional 4-hydroxy-2-oxoglutarate aldolase/2-dehydro-3-deoxy-phosphogluconate aldolase [Trueperaceae bacterium]